MLGCIAKLLIVSGAFAAQTENAAEMDEKLLRSHGIGATGPDLVRYLRDRTLSKEQQDQLAARVQQLGDSSYSVRVQATSQLIKAGELARPFLVEVLKNPASNLELTRRAELCLRQITTNPDAPHLAAVIRLLGVRKPSDGAAVLIGFLPFATDAEVLASAQETLNVLAMRDNEPEPAIVSALKDPRPHLRGAAAESLVRGGGLPQKNLVEPLLRDPQPSVRFQVALALVARRDRDAVPELIKSLGTLPAEQTWAAEELLHRLAGDQGPKDWVAPGTGVKVQAQWQTWWTKNQSSVDLAKLDELPKVQGFTVIAQLGKGVGGKIVELGPNKEVRWHIDNVQYPVDAHVVGPNRVLIAEYIARRVTERDFQGKIHWERQIDLPIGCQRLPGNKTFIASRRQLVILDAAGKEVFTHQAQNTTIAAATVGPDGHVYLVSSTGLFQKLSPEGREVKSFQVGPMYTLGANIDVLPAGRILVPQYRENRVAEYDASGKVVWEAKMNLPTSAVRLSNGNTLVTMGTQMRVVEINRQGQVVWEHATDSRPLRARKR